MIEVTRDEQESLDGLVKRFRRQVAKSKVLQEVKGRAHFIPNTLKNRLKRRKQRRRRSPEDKRTYL